MTEFETGFFRIKLTPLDETNELSIIVEDNCDYGDCDEEANFELDRAGARTLGELLIRYANTGTTNPPSAPRKPDGLSPYDLSSAPSWDDKAKFLRDNENPAGY